MLQNRVNPWGELCRVQARGTLMGNRGVLHDVRQEIVRQSARTAWVTCELTFKDWRRPKPFSTLNNYSELFFLDQATAFAAGHRPCTTCRRAHSTAFKSAWIAANSTGTTDVSLADIDKVLKKDRTDAAGKKVTYEFRLGDLPIGTMFAVDSVAYVVSRRGYLPWSFSGYGAPVEMAADRVVTVLTPRSVVAAFTRGFEPEMHQSAWCTF